MEKKNWGRWVYLFDNDYPRKYVGVNNEDCFCDLTDVRYVLGEEFDCKDVNGSKTLICIGLNPSMAVPRNLDNTLHRVRKYALGRYKAWYMLNIYPFRETYSELIPKDFNRYIAEKNLLEIKNLTSHIKEADVWCAWGSGIEDRSYFKKCLFDILDHLQRLNGYSFVQRIPIADKDLTSHPLTGKDLTSHPLHPIASIRCNVDLVEFNVKEYIENL